MLLKELCSLIAPSGAEDAVRDFLRKRVRADEVWVDSMGNLIAHRRGKGLRVMLSAHMDEVGVIVSEITDSGFLKFKTIGGIDTAVLCSKQVLLGEERVPGIIAAKAVHLQSREERGKKLRVSDLAIDIGAKDRAEAESKVSLGTYGTFAGAYTEFGDGLVKSKALDDRVGCAALLELMEESYDLDLYFAFTTQEEVGLRGSMVAAHQIQPQVALVLEGTTCSDVFGTKKHLTVTRLGGGVVLTSMDRAAVADGALRALLIETAEREGIAWQNKRSIAGGTDAGSIQRSTVGVKTAVMAVPCRYIHSPVSVMAKCDYQSMVSLARASLRALETQEGI